MGDVNDQVLRRLVLDRVVTVIESDGEDAVRVVDVARHVGTAVATVFHLFGSREGLVEAAQVDRYVRDLGSTIEELDVATALASGLDDFRALVIRFVRDLLANGQASTRRSRLAVAGRAASDPGLGAVIGSAHRSLCSGLAAALQRAVDNTWVDPDLNATATAHWMLEMLFARGLAELGDQPLDRRAWDDLALRSVLRTLFND